MDNPLLRFRQAKDLHNLAEQAGLSRDPKTLRAILGVGASGSKQLAQVLGKHHQLRATAELLRENPFPVPRVDELGAFLLPENAVLEGIIEEINRPLWYPFNRFPSHKIIAGDSGTGKTNYLYSQILQVAQNYPAWIFDKDKIDYRHLLRLNSSFLVFNAQRDLKFNPLEVPDGVNPHDHVATFVTVFVKLLGLLHGSIGFLIPICYELYRNFGIFDGSRNFPNLSDLYDLVRRKRFQRGSRKVLYRDSVSNRLEGLLAACPDTFGVSHGFPISELCRHSCVFEVKGLIESHAQCLMAWQLFSLFNYFIANSRRGRGLALLVVIDEAKWAAPPGFNENIGFVPLTTLISQGREAGISILIADQSADLNKSVFKSELKLSFRVTGKDIARIQDHFRLTDEQATYLSKLERAQACVKLPGIDPFLIRIPRVRIR